MCTVSRVKSKRCHVKVNSIVDFQQSLLTHAQLFNRNQSFLVPVLDIPEPPAPVLLDKGNGGSGNKIGYQLPVQSLNLASLGKLSR